MIRQFNVLTRLSFYIGLMGSMLLGVRSYGSEYCAAIRGNGELMPAHWGAMADIVEKRGMPSAFAGGSSASLTIFLIESISMNPLAKSSAEQALLIKSFQGYLEALSQTQDGKVIQTLFANKNALGEIFKKGQDLDRALGDADFLKSVKKVLTEIESIGISKDLQNLLNPEFVEFVSNTVNIASLPNASKHLGLIKYRSQQIKLAITKFGSFDAANDETLFVRPGLINFEGLSQEFGKMANFYAHYNVNSFANSSRGAKLQAFLSSCKNEAVGLTWTELSLKKPECQGQFVKLVLEYLSEPAGRKSRLEDVVGQNKPALISTSVITGQSFESFAKYYYSYQNHADPKFHDFNLQNNSDLRFGYWGPSKMLTRIEDNFLRLPEFKQDPKSQKFLSLGEAKWGEVLLFSPAEPGLSRILVINDTMLSAGGWSDLHPVAVLKASGCKNVIYVTRKGGESRFAKAIYQRLTQAPEAELNSLYSHQSNSQSSMLFSQSLADEIKCTNWNGFNVKTQLVDLIAESYKAPLSSSDKLCSGE